MQTIRQEAEGRFIDNTTGEISAADLRTWAIDLCDTLTPGYGILNVETAPASQTFDTTPSVVTAYDTALLATEPFTADASTGVVTVTDNVVADITFTASAEFAGNRSLLIVVYKNGVATPYRSQVDGEGNGNPVTLSASGIIEVSPNDTLDLRGVIESSTSVSFNELAFICRAIPLRDPPV